MFSLVAVLRVMIGGRPSRRLAKTPTLVAAGTSLLAWLALFPMTIQGVEPDVVTLRLDPPFAEQPLGTDTCVTATADQGAAAAGAPIGFFVEGGNPLPVTSTVLDAAGQATFCYRGSHLGGDTVVVFHDYDRDRVFDNADEFADMVTRFWLPPVEISVSIDVLPGSTRNPILLRRGGVVPVAILTTASFDALAIDPASLCFGAAPPDPPRSDCTSDAERQLGTDIDSDGDLDLVIHFQVDESGLLRGDVEACLTGLTLDGTAIVGCDAVDAR